MTERASRGAGRGARVGLAVGGGWLLYDAWIYLSSGHPGLVLDLGAGSVVALLGCALFGALAERWRPLVPVALAAAGAGVLVPVALDLEPSPRVEWATGAIFFLVLAYASTARWGGRRLGAVRLGACLAVVGCALLVRLQDVGLHAWMLVLTAPVALALGFVPRASARRTLTALVMLLPLAMVIRNARAARPSRADLEPPSAAARPEAPNLVLIVLDTVRADHLAPYGYDRVTTPELDRWVDDHFTVYRNARSTSSWTLPSHASLFTGLYPAEHGTVYAGKHGRALRSDVPTLAELLRDDGYRTGAVVANNAYLRAMHYQLARGYEHYDDRLAGKVRTYLPLAQLVTGDLRAGHLGYRDARAITNQALAWIDGLDGDRPFFLTVNYMDAHQPNIPPPSLQGAFGEARTADDLVKLLYDLELLYMDGHVARLLGGMEAREMFDDTAVIITSDHGEGLGDHGVPGHGWVLYEALLRVPLYIKPAGGRSTREVDEPLTGADVFHLALRSVGLPSEPAREVPGIVAELHVHPDEHQGDPEEAYRAESADLLAWIEEDIKFIASADGRVEAYDLAEDPRELEPLDLPGDRLEHARRLARAWWAANPIRTGEQVVLDEDAVERLKALGYN